MVANNSSGMACGTEFNTYQTLESLVLVLPSGTVLNTGAADATEKLRALEPELHEGLLRLKKGCVTNQSPCAPLKDSMKSSSRLIITSTQLAKHLSVLRLSLSLQYFSKSLKISAGGPSVTALVECSGDRACMTSRHNLENLTIILGSCRRPRNAKVVRHIMC